MKGATFFDWLHLWLHLSALKVQPVFDAILDNTRVK